MGKIYCILCKKRFKIDWSNVYVIAKTSAGIFLMKEIVFFISGGNEQKKNPMSTQSKTVRNRNMG